MTIYVDEPMWPWHGRLWSHLISDESIDELHAFARAAQLRYLSFGFDHYDVPDALFDHVQFLGAELIDPRDIVKKLRRAGLRTSRGKAAKRWARVPGGVDALVEASGLPADIAFRLEQAVGAEPGDIEALHRPDETAVIASGPDQPRPETMAALRSAVGSGRLVIASTGPWGWSIEVVDPLTVHITRH